MRRWFFELVGRDQEIEEIAEKAEVAGREIVREGGRTYLCSSAFDLHEDLRRARDEAERRLGVLNGVVRLLHLEHEPVRAGGASLDHGDGRPRTLLIEPSSAVQEVRFSLATITREGEAPPDPIWKTYIERALHNEAMARALWLFGNQALTPSTLYHVAEVAAAALSPNGNPKDLASLDKLLGHGKAGLERRKRFDASVNHPEVFGYEARHAITNRPAPDEPMSLQEARQTIADLLRMWFEGRHPRRTSRGGG